MSPATELAESRILITGASSGVGLAAAREFAGRGARVALLARRAELLSELAEELGEAALALPTDVADPEAVAAAVGGAWDAWGGLDLAINAAGVGMPTPLEQLDADGWQEVIDINLSGTFYVCREAGVRMAAAGGGSIVNVGSELSSIGMAMYAPYCASKFGVIGLTKALAAELAPTVRVNVVCPGPIDTPMMDAELELVRRPRRGAGRGDRAGAAEALRRSGGGGRGDPLPRLRGALCDRNHAAARRRHDHGLRPEVTVCG